MVFRVGVGEVVVFGVGMRCGRWRLGVGRGVWKGLWVGVMVFVVGMRVVVVFRSREWVVVVVFSSGSACW